MLAIVSSNCSRPASRNSALKAFRNGGSSCPVRPPHFLSSWSETFVRVGPLETPQLHGDRDSRRPAIALPVPPTARLRNTGCRDSGNVRPLSLPYAPNALLYSTQRRQRYA